MLSQLSLRFPKKLIDALKNRAVTEKTSVNALTERFVDASCRRRGRTIRSGQPKKPVCEYVENCPKT